MVPDAHNAFDADPDTPDSADAEPSETEYWKQAEENVAKKSGGERQIGSGRFEEYKGDIDTDNEKFEVKSTETKGLYVTKETLTKIYKEATDEKKRPRLVVSLRNDEVPDDWVLMPMDDYALLNEKLDLNREEE